MEATDEHSLRKGPSGRQSPSLPGLSGCQVRALAGRRGCAAQRPSDRPSHNSSHKTSAEPGKLRPTPANTARDSPWSEPVLTYPNLPQNRPATLFETVQFGHSGITPAATLRLQDIAGPAMAIELAIISSRLGPMRAHRGDGTGIKRLVTATAADLCHQRRGS
jgi:hypothetical protein